jgi:hypothetical protein
MLVAADQQHSGILGYRRLTEEQTGCDYDCGEN